MSREVSAAAAQGNRSENAENIYGKRRLREIDRRVRFLRKRFNELVVVKPGEVDQERVFFQRLTRRSSVLRRPAPLLDRPLGPQGSH